MLSALPPSTINNTTTKAIECSRMARNPDVIAPERAARVPMRIPIKPTATNGTVAGNSRSTDSHPRTRRLSSVVGLVSTMPDHMISQASPIGKPTNSQFATKPRRDAFISSDYAFTVKNNSMSAMFVSGPYVPRTKNTTLYSPFGNSGVGFALRKNFEGRSFGPVS